MKTTLIVLMSTLLSVAYAADPASTTTSGSGGWKAVSEKAQAAHQEALAIHNLLKSKNADAAAAAERAAQLDQHVGALHEAVKALEGSSLAGPDAQRLRESVELLKVMTENRVKMLAEAKSSERGKNLATAKNIAMRAEQILKASRKIGG